MTVRLQGIPYDAHSSFLRGPALAPDAVREALSCGSANYTTELGVDVDPGNGSWSDLGNLELADDVELALEHIRNATAVAIADGSPILSIGGDHLVTWPVVEAVSATTNGLTIVHFDAHPDLYDELDGDRFSHACPFARIMEAGLADRLIQIGIRTMTAHQQEQAERFGVEVLHYRTWDGNVPAVDGDVYISIDVDALDPAFAPGVSHFEPGGMTVRELINALHQIGASGARISGADVVEVNPERDVHGVTAMVGAKLVRELLGLMQ